MSLLDVEKFVFYRGILGCSLLDVPGNLLDDLKKPTALEIVENEVVSSLPSSLNNPDFCFPKTFSIEEITDYSKYSVKPKIDAWRQIIFAGKPLHSGVLADFVSTILQNPNGVDKKFVKSRVAGCEKNISKWTRTLVEIGCITTQKKADAEYIYFNTNLLENEQIEYIQGSDGLKRSIARPSPRTQDLRKALKENSRVSVKSKIEDYIQIASNLIKELPKGVLIKDLKSFLNVDDEILDELVKYFQKRTDYKLLDSDGASLTIMFVNDPEPYITANNNEATIIRLCQKYAIIIISEIPKEIKTIKNNLGLDDEDFIKILECNGFNIVEVRYKYMNSDFVAYSADLNEDSIDLMYAFDKAKNKIVRYFKVKVQNIFLRNSFLTSFDNNFSAYLNERVSIFYKYITSVMSKSNGFFLFNNEAILNMDFYSFAKIVPLRLEFQFLEIIGEVADDESLKVERKYLELLSLNEYEDLNKRCLEFAKTITVEQVIGRLPIRSDQRANLQSRIGVFEFEKSLFSLIKYNIFEGFSDPNYLYFEAMEGIGNYMERMLLTIPEEWPDSACNVPYPVRKIFYEKIGEFSAEEFFIKTKELVEKEYKGEWAEFFMKKLNTFDN